MIGVFCVIFFLSVALVACGGESVDFSMLESAEKAYKERLKRTSLPFMSLETMFPDAQARALAEAAGDGDIDTINRLVSQGVDVNAQGTQHATPLYWAMQNLKGFTRLLELGADPNVVYGDGSTIIHEAVWAEDTALLETALRFGADPNIRAYDVGRTPLMAAIGAPLNIKMMELLLEAGADIEAKNTSGRTVLSIAGGTAKFEEVYFLLNRGADYRPEDSGGLGLLDYIADFREDMIPGSKGAHWLNKVIEWLTARGVEIPPKRKK